MKKLTAVEWLWEQIDNAIPFQNIQTSQIFYGLLEQAKELEKEQIIEAFDIACDDHNRIGKEYYSETFKQVKS